MIEPTWAEIDARNRDLEAKKQELGERLTRALSQNFSLNELKLLWAAGPGFPSALIVGAFEAARLEARR
jgi:hypothetical protein